MSRHMRKQTTRSDTNWSVQPLQQTRSLKLRIKEEEGLYYPCSENKGANQLCSYCTADQRLCFCCRLLVSDAVAHISCILQLKAVP